MGAATDLQSEGLRRLIVNAVFAGLDMDVRARFEAAMLMLNDAGHRDKLRYLYGPDGYMRADPAAFAMQFVTTRSFVTSNIFGARNMEQLETIFSSLEIDWTEEMEKSVNELHGRIQNPCP